MEPEPQEPASDLAPEPEPEPDLIIGAGPDTVAAAQFLREVPRFAKLTDAAMLQVATKMQLRTFDCEQVIFRKGDPGSTFYMIVSGSINVQQDGQRDLGARDYFDHAALISKQHLCSTTATVTSAGGCTCYALDKNALDSTFSFQLLFPLLQDMLPSLFKQADEDRSGSLDQEEVRALINTLGFTDVPDRYIAGIWGVFDVDGDGVLDLEEVKEMVEVRLCRFCTGSARGDIAIATDIDTDTDTAVAQRYGYRYRYEFNPCRYS